MAFSALTLVVGAAVAVAVFLGIYIALGNKSDE